MFVGHTAVALAAKSQAPKTSLGLLVVAAYLIDLLWPIFLLIGIEHVRIDPGNTVFTPLDFESYPWSHSLLMVVIWGALLAMVVRRADARTRFIIFSLVVSHWILDVITHRPDMPLWPGASPRLGLGLWNSIPATLVVEGAIFAIGISMYVRATRARDRIGSIGFWALIVFQIAIWVSQPWSPPPPNVEMLGIVGNASWLFVMWAWWIDKHRQQRNG